MNKFYSLLALFYVCLAICLVACSGGRNKAEVSPATKHYLWKISDENSSLWVLGSIHLADSTLYPLAPVIDSAFARSDELAVELNMNDEEVVKEIGKESVSQGMLEDRLLRDILPPEMWKTLDSLCAAWDIPMVVFEKMRPWLVATTLSAYAFEQAGLNSEYGIDYVLLDRAAADGKAIVGLETAEEQIGALADTTESDSAGVYYLKTTLREIAELESLVKNLIHAWKTGDDDLLRSILDKDDEEDEEKLSGDQKFKDEYEQRVYVNRNAKMADSIAAFLREDRNVFVVVGVAHLALEKDNVVDVLKRRGLKVERF
ncbi:MAG: TraB/GumN family protein [Fibrobacter sp.]|nr:TraB/GumN family protein [Fibrobacter sp.]MBQ5463281.1 TraB/GumN family protein [Fibrobacter sp.]